MTMTKVPKLDSFYRLVALGDVASTNQEAMALAAGGAGEGTLVWARSQTAGKGRRGRGWISPPGNLYLSLVLRPKAPVARVPEIAFVAALAAGDAIAALLPPSSEMKLKWPNDILVGGKKAAGLLLEAGADGYLVLGVGINVASYPEGLDLPATSLNAEGATGVGVGEALEGFCRAFTVWYGRWRHDGFGVIREAWLAGAAGVGQTIRVRLESESLTGVFLGLDRDGALRLGDGAGNERRITAGDVVLPPLTAEQAGVG